MHDRSRRPGNTTRTVEDQGQPDCAQTRATKDNQIWGFQDSIFFANVKIMHCELCIVHLIEGIMH